MNLRWCLSVTVLLALHGAGLAADHSGRVVDVLDGDTVHVLTASKQLIRVRLAGIDAPEKQQAHGAVAMRTLFALAQDRQVEVVGHKVDRYGRLVGKVLVAHSDINLQMVERGLAWHYKQYEHEQEPQDRQLYADAELRAREQHIGLWAEQAPMPPWDYRSARRKRPSRESAAPVQQAPAPVQPPSGSVWPAIDSYPPCGERPCSTPKPAR